MDHRKILSGWPLQNVHRHQIEAAILWCDSNPLNFMSYAVIITRRLMIIAFPVTTIHRLMIVTGSGMKLEVAEHLFKNQEAIIASIYLQIYTTYILYILINIFIFMYKYRCVHVQVLRNMYIYVQVVIYVYVYKFLHALCPERII